jgi:hypothetical protein
VYLSSSQLEPTVVGHAKLEKLECKGRRSSMKPSQKSVLNFFKASNCGWLGVVKKCGLEFLSVFFLFWGFVLGERCMGELNWVRAILGLACF